MASSLLESVISGSEETRTFLLQDTSMCNGRLLLKAIALQCLQRFSFLHLFLFDVHPQFWLCGVPPDSMKRLTVHDCYTDYLGWSSTTASGPIPLQEATPISFLCRVDSQKATPMQKMNRPDCAIVIDSLSTILDFNSTPCVCRLVHQLSRHCGLVVCLLHSDLHGNHVTSQLNHVTSLCMEINPLPTSLQAGYHFQLRLLHHKPSGKLAVKTELVTITNDYKVMSSPSSHRHGHLKGAPEETPDPTANLTFDLTLNEREKEERGKLVLPYHHSAEKKRALLLAGSGRIFYQPDEADDYDNSDPDDDLDI